ncbi:MAG: acetyl-CoA carboxylase carboxyl transferase subunit beta [Rhodospirillales bacterium]|nr:acetyl-CoA carboxylase carboxyl transferase subunit beta [Rhodospirillales bacterium]
MSWLTYLVRPKFRDIVGTGRDKGEEEWLSCPRCGHRDRESRWRDALRVCPACDLHMPLPPPERLALLFGDGEFHAIELPSVRADPLRFRDVKRYSERLKEAQQATGRPEALVVCHGAIGGGNGVVAVLDPVFLGGTIGTAVGEGLITAAQLAVVQESPLVVVVSSAGLRVQEGVLSLLQPGRIAVALHQVRERRLPLIVVLADPHPWPHPWPYPRGAAAAFTDAAHVVIAEPASHASFRRDGGEWASGENRPAHGDTADAEGSAAAMAQPEMTESAEADIIVHRRELALTVAHFLDLLRHPRPSAEVLRLRSENAAKQL